VTFLRLSPRSRVLPRIRRAYEKARALPRFFTPSALPNHRGPPLLGLPTQVTLRPRAYHAPRRFSPSTVSLVSFQPGALTGFRPSELDLTEIAAISRWGHPSCELVSPGSSFRCGRCDGPVAHSRPSLQGDDPLPVEAQPLQVLIACGALALLGVDLPGAFPFSALGLLRLDASHLW
jgi:hypothetical protein